MQLSTTCKLFLLKDDHCDHENLINYLLYHNNLEHNPHDLLDKNSKLTLYSLSQGCGEGLSHLLSRCPQSLQYSNEDGRIRGGQQEDEIRTSGGQQ